MSKTIEFVGKNIKDIKISIEGYKRLKTYYLSQENYEDCVIMSLEQNIKYLENKLSVWEQIKAEREREAQERAAQTGETPAEGLFDTLK